MKPLIGVTCSWNSENERWYSNRMYVEAVRMAGGVPLLLAGNGEDDIVEVTSVVHGLILSGGVDVDPIFFGEDPIPSVREISPERDSYEITLSKLALSSGMPVLGICRGAQVMNIAAGGDVYQDIYNQQPNQSLIKHWQESPSWHPTHNITVQEGTLLASILGAGTRRVNSYHHQAVRKLAPGFVVSARSADGIIEAIEKPGDLFTLGVQCHPETLWERHSVFINLFTKLVEAAKTKSFTSSLMS